MDRKILFLWGATAVVVIITLLVAHYKVASSPRTVALHYNVIVGVDVLGNKNQLYEIPSVAVIIAAINLAVLRVLKLPEFYSYLLAAISLVCSVFLLAATLFLFAVN